MTAPVPTLTRMARTRTGATMWHCEMHGLPKGTPLMKPGLYDALAGRLEVGDVVLVKLESEAGLVTVVAVDEAAGTVRVRRICGRRIV